MASKKQAKHIILTVSGIVVCVILAPILIINCILLIKGLTDPGKVPSVFNLAPMVVLTDSMVGNNADSLNSGDMIFVKTVKPEEVKEGDIISFYDPAGNGSTVTTHRVVEIIEENGALRFRTKGDNNNREDRELVDAEALVGVCAMRIPGAGDIAMFMQSATGSIVCVLLPVALLVGFDLVRRRIYDKNQKQDTDALLAELEALRAEKAEKEASALVNDDATTQN